MNESNKKHDAIEQRTTGNGRAARLIALALIACGMISLGLLHRFSQMPYSNHRFVTQNWAIALIALETLMAYGLKRLQGGVYWFFWLQIQNPVLDERQRTVRQKVFEQAYAYSLLILLLTSSYIVSYVPSWPNNAISSDVGHSAIVGTAWAVGVFLVSLPSILAAWRKDS